ncbi:MAG TPA: hypothetical protein VIM70_14725 [Clostridium sp.]|uniref:hypothetical protein n=1 Tax=Clostridium sp. TaxID=1506 RepID=UPI002F92E7FF
MAIHQNIIKKNFKLRIIVLCLFLSIFTLMACSNKVEKINKNVVINEENVISNQTLVKGKDQIVENIKTTKIAFEKNNNVYIYDETNQQIKSLGDNSKLKDLLAISPDKTKIVFRYFNEGKEIYPPHIIVYDIKTGKLTDIVINNENVQQIIELKWIDDENILVTGHIDPSASGYTVYNIKSKAEIISCIGTIRDVTINKKNILYSNTPHIFPQVKANLYLNNNKIFETNIDKEEIFDGVLSRDGKILAFRSYIEGDKKINSQTRTYLNVANVNSDGKGINGLLRIAINSDTSGVLKFDDKNNISIIGDDFIYKLESGKLNKEKNILKKQEELSAEQLKKFKTVLAKQFPKDIISEKTLLEDIGIYNFVTF